MIRKTALLTALVSVLFACSDKEAIEEMPESGVNNGSVRKPCGYVKFTLSVCII